VPQSCTGITQAYADTCSGTGTCDDNGTLDCSPYVCSGASCRSNCTSDSHCISTHYCSGNACTPKKSDGQSCSAGNQCSSENCVDGVCCDTNCDDTCQACNISGSVGSCSNFTANTDPASECGLCRVCNGNVSCVSAPSGTDYLSECSQQSVSTCGRDGTCDGSGGCRLWAGGTICQPQKCGTTNVQWYADTCNGSGTCVDNSGLSCDPYVCSGTSCPTSCTASSHCISGYFCDFTDNTCQVVLGNGTACNNDSQCSSGFCTEGVCCNSQCGTVLTLPANQSEAQLKSAGWVESGAGAGSITWTTTSTGAMKSIGNTSTVYFKKVFPELTGNFTITFRYYTTDNDGGRLYYATNSGAYIRIRGTDNGPWIQFGSDQHSFYHLPGDVIFVRIRVTGTQHEYYVENETRGNTLTASYNRGKVDAGEGYLRFAAYWQHLQEFRDLKVIKKGVCDTCATGSCSSVPDNQDPIGECGFCKSCDGGGSCKTIASGSDPLSHCLQQGTSTCDQDGSCDGSGACRNWASGTVCNSQTCSNGVEYLNDTCNGGGTCNDGGTNSCNGYQCNGVNCRTSCSNATHCVSNYFCLDGSCVDLFPNGTQCNSASQCYSGNCVDGVCCNSACGGTCENCAVIVAGLCSNYNVDEDPANECGSCKTCSGGSSCKSIAYNLDPKGNCDQQTFATCGRTGGCDGSGGCALWPGGTACTATYCSGLTFYGVSTCNGAGTCQNNASATSCTASTACQQANCSAVSGCGETAKSDGTACGTAPGTCSATCGGYTGCLTYTGHSYCSSGSCHYPGEVSCTATAPCRNPICNPSTGCGVDTVINTSFTNQYCENVQGGGGTPEVHGVRYNTDTCDGSGNAVDGGHESCFPYKCEDKTDLGVAPKQACNGTCTGSTPNGADFADSARCATGATCSKTVFGIWICDHPVCQDGTFCD